jgi:1,4-dihydroxy-2-naphthoate octaprenyltransferase
MSTEQGRDRTVKSVITCDLEGRIETFGDGAEQVFGYSSEEIIGKQRVSLFSPGLIVLEHVGGWLKTAREEGEYQGRTVFVRKDGTPFAADIRITPTWKDGEQIGYCGVTVARPDVPVEEAMPEIGLATKIFRWLVITRAPFLTATIVPILIGAAWVAARGGRPFPWLAFALTMIGGIAMHVAANTFNDYFDWRSGTDPANNDYFQPLSGGSRSIELGLISEKALFWVASTALTIGLAMGLALMVMRGPALILFGVVGAFSVYFYTAPPLRLAARRGLGELLVGMNFGPLMVAGTVYALTGAVSWVDFFVGLPVGLLITAVLYINQFPDAESDEATGKINLVIVLGKERARWGYLLIVFGAFVLTLGGVMAGLLPLGALLMLIALPLAVYTTATLFRYYADRKLVSANQYTIVLHMLSGLLLAAGVLWSERLIGLVG